MARCSKEVVLRVIEQEKKKLDNTSVFGGFNRFLKGWLQKEGHHPEEWLGQLEGYEDLSREERRRLLLTIESALRASPAPGKGVSPKSRKFVPSLAQPVRYLKGVGPALEKKLNRLEIFTVEDLLFFFPRTYRDRGTIKPIRSLQGVGIETIQGQVVQHKIEPTRRGPLLKVVVSDGTGEIRLVCFNRGYLAQVLKKGTWVRVSGNFRYAFGAWETATFEYEVGKLRTTDFERLVPVYPLTEGLPPKKLRAVILSALETCLHEVPEVLPPALRERLQIPAKREAIRELHLPSTASFEELQARRSPAHLALILEEFLLFALSLKIRRRTLETFQVPPCPLESPLAERFIRSLPFSLTEAQKRVCLEIAHDLASGRVMNRLVQGDVGSGKTIVAVISALRVVETGRQVAFMVPTEILAEQHYSRFREPLAALGVRVGLLKGGNTKEKRQLLEAIQKKEVDIVIGTHALIEEKVAFADLGLVIVDEQHRFGVLQRAKLREKATVPHTLVMTATPIPRTLALTLYGDLDVSVVDEKPAGRKPTRTLCFPLEERFKAYNRVRKLLREGRQAYVVCPAIEESEEEIANVQEVFEELQKKWLSEFRIEVIHGKLSSREKEDIMHRFSRGDVDVLVATSVIEVGIDVPRASVMVVENAERFGLAQLHQLRGRIGRGSEEGVCILLAALSGENVRKRMAILTATDDGFRIAEEDLRLRGPGEFYGVRQHGVPEFHLADPFADWPLLERAHQEAERIITEDPFLERPEHRPLRQEIERRFGRYLEFGEVG
ncbi:ATP-dependent DNA helicase RecG [Candidatus Caldatribacterium sp. SIUC1]|uniref:ATP-dependent DNA helicase RecG n=1 Tax=Candidatus Caldatribacterium sp. SIUC1 TaxID=3418365 RepID=UPI003F68E924